jgi:hypothetical protein
VAKRQGDDESQPAVLCEVSLSLDTLWVDMDQEKLSLVWRGRTPVRSVKLSWNLHAAIDQPLEGGWNLAGRVDVNHTGEAYNNLLNTASFGEKTLPNVRIGVDNGRFSAFLFATSSQRRFNRFTAFLDITGNREHLSYQQYQAMIAIAQGGTTGAGPGRGLTKLGDFLPLAHSDFIFAVIAEELGLIGVIAVLGGFLVLTFCGVQVALASSDRFGALLAGGIVGWLVVQTLINVGGVTGIMPVTGLTLPFFSAGGSSLFVCMVAAGLLLNVARHAR